MRNIELLETNFLVVHSNSIPPTFDTNGKLLYAPIAPMLLPIIFNTNIVRIDINTYVPTQQNWYSAGNVTRFIPSINSKLKEGKRLDIGSNVVIFEPLTIDYQLIIYVPKWFNSLELSVYEYTGIDS